MLDSIVSQAMNVGGAFEKILTTRDMNLAAGLGQGIIQQQPAFVGSVGDSARRSRRKPVKIPDARNEVEAFQNLAKAAKNAAHFVEDRIDVDLSQPITEPDRPGRGASVI